MNLTTHKIIEGAHVRINDFVEKREEESNKESEAYKRFFYYETDTLPNLSRRKATSCPKSPKSPKSIELQLV